MGNLCGPFTNKTTLDESVDISPKKKMKLSDYGEMAIKRDDSKHGTFTDHLRLY